VEGFSCDEIAVLLQDRGTRYRPPANAVTASSEWIPRKTRRRSRAVCPFSAS